MLACVLSRKILGVSSSSKFFLKAFCLVIIAMYLAGIRREMGVKRLVFPLFSSPTSHYFFLVLFEAAVEQSNEVFPEVHHLQLVETVL